MLMSQQLARSQEIIERASLNLSSFQHLNEEQEEKQLLL